MPIHVFKTSVHNIRDLKSVAPLLNMLVEQHGRWDFDLEDCDHVLRVKSSYLDPQVIIERVTTAGFLCCELPD